MVDLLKKYIIYYLNPFYVYLLLSPPFLSDKGGKEASLIFIKAVFLPTFFFCFFVFLSKEKVFKNNSPFLKNIYSFLGGSIGLVFYLLMIYFLFKDSLYNAP